MILTTHPYNLKYLQKWIGQSHDQKASSVRPTVRLSTIEYGVKFVYHNIVYIRDILGKDGGGLMAIRSLDGHTQRIGSDKYVELLYGDVQHLYDGFAQFLHSIVTIENLPISRKVASGELSWCDSDIIVYSGGPSAKMTSEEYIQMCIYFGWAKERYDNYLVWYADGKEYLAPYL